MVLSFRHAGNGSSLLDRRMCFALSVAGRQLQL